MSFSINAGEIKVTVYPALVPYEAPERPGFKEFYIPADNPFADHHEPVTAFYAAKNIDRLYLKVNGNTGYIYDNFSPNSYIVVYWGGSGYSLSLCWGSENEATCRGYRETDTPPTANNYTTRNTFSNDGKKVYYRWLEDALDNTSIVQTEPTINTNYSVRLTYDSGRRAWLMVYGGYDS